MLLIVGVLGLSYSFVSTLSFQCGLESKGCMAALFASFEYPAYQANFSVAQSTAALPIDGVGLVPFIQLVSGYTLLIAVGLLIVLECIELYYLRRFMGRKGNFSLR
jgi:hypothetical protein